MRQKKLKLTVRPLGGETSRDNAFRRWELKNKISDAPAGFIPPEKLFCDLLKRLAREAMAAVTECPAVAMPHALARLDDIKATIQAAMRADFVPGAETLRSAEQLAYAHTLADFLACIDLTRRAHRAPVFLNSRDSELAALRHDFSQLAGLVCLALPHVKMPDCFCVPESEVEL